MEGVSRRWLRREQGFQLIHVALAGGGVVAILVLQVDLLAGGLDWLADVLRSVAGQIDILW